MSKKNCVFQKLVVPLHKKIAYATHTTPISSADT